jgi:hypothetical protein
MVYFHPPTGTYLRVISEHTQHLVSDAPRAVMFGITNACNLRCDFCSRDQARDSLWTVDSAFEVLRDLANAGTLEVAFGGGEPFLFRGFATLIRRLHAETALALHVTTNGTHLGALAELRGMLGIVRVSVYEQTDLVTIAAAMTSQKWGANILVDDGALFGLNHTLKLLASLGAHDVSLLSYIGAGRQLSSAGERVLAQIVKESPLPVRMSVCFGQRIGVTQFAPFAQNDCGAGADFVSITPDRKLQSCSFQDEGFVVSSAADVLMVWRDQQRTLRQASTRDGCARSNAPNIPNAFKPDAFKPEVRAWQSFSGNNSGECYMVAHFESVEDAEKYIARLIPGYEADTAYSAPWREWCTAEKISINTDSTTPSELLQHGTSVFARGYDADDAFPELRALAWKHDAEVRDGIHVHDASSLLFAVASANPERTLARAQPYAGVRHGSHVFGAVPIRSAHSDRPALASALDAARFVAEWNPLVTDIVFDAVSQQQLVATASRLGVEIDRTPRLMVKHYDHEPEARRAKAASFRTLATDHEAASLEGNVLIDKITRRKRLALLGYQRHAAVTTLEADVVKVSAMIWPVEPAPQKGKPAPKASPVQVALVESALRRHLAGQQVTLSCERSHSKGVTVTAETNTPLAVFEALQHIRSEFENTSLWVGVSDTNELGMILRNLAKRLP